MLFMVTTEGPEQSSLQCTADGLWYKLRKVLSVTNITKVAGLCSGNSPQLSVSLTRKQVNCLREIPGNAIPIQRTGKHCFLRPLCFKLVLRCYHYSQTLLANLEENRRYLILNCYQVCIKLPTTIRFSTTNSSLLEVSHILTLKKPLNKQKSATKNPTF